MIQYLLYKKLGGPQGRSERVSKISPPPGFHLRTDQFVASCYTDWAIPAPFKTGGFTFSVQWTPLIVWRNLWTPSRRIDTYLLTAIGLTPGGSSTVHTYTQTVHRTIQTFWKSAGRASSWRFILWHLSYNSLKNRVDEECQLARWRYIIKEQEYVDLTIKYINYSITQVYNHILGYNHICG